MKLTELSIKVKENKGWFWLLSLVLATFTVAISSINQALGFTFIGVLVAIILVMSVLRHPIYATLINIFIVYLGFFFIYRILGLYVIPLGIAVDSLNLLALIVLIIRGQFKGHKTPIGIFIIAWFGICLLELINPNATSRAAWFLEIRGTFNLIIPFFLFYTYFSTQKGALKNILNIWLFLGTLTALYTIYQELAGYPPWDLEYITADEQYYQLLYTFGRLRKIGTLAGPSETGVVMAFNGVMALGLFFNEGIRKRIKFLYLLVFLFSSWAMLYTGTRTATLIWVIGIVFYTIMTRRKILILGGVFCFFLVVPFLVVTGKGGSAVKVMFTAFNADEDPSMQVRIINQRIIRNYILRAPIGYGMGSTGSIARKYSPSAYLSHFPPDSEYVKVAIQYGFIGLALWLTFQYIILNTGIKSVAEYKEETNMLNVTRATLCVTFMIVITQYPQEVLLLQVPKLLYSLCLAILSLKPSDVTEF